MEKQTATSQKDLLGRVLKRAMEIYSHDIHMKDERELHKLSDAIDTADLAHS